MREKFNEFPTHFRTSRPWRSNSLTPPTTSGNLPVNPPNSQEWIQYQAKGRSHSLTYVRDSINSEAPNTASAILNISPATSASTLDEKEIEEMIRNLQEGSGMRGEEFAVLERELEAL